MININYILLLFLITGVWYFYLNFDKIKTKLIKYLFGKADTEKYVKICHKCGSTEVKIDFSNPVVWDSGTPVKYKCGFCGRIASIFPEVDSSKINQYRKDLKLNIEKGVIKVDERNQLDVVTGFSVGILEIYYTLAMFGIMLLIMGLLSINQTDNLSVIQIYIGIFCLGLFFYLIKKNSLNKKLKN